MVVIQIQDYLNYYIITSGCPGWYTNQQKYSYATSLNGLWSTPAPIGNEKTGYLGHIDG
ncbi:hypothetical protein LL037_04965 [Clostridium estertheticum]|uniref:hypothetical protein n=1 Tax=Clostridium estertheticum TaxID=238834 RepID=UPI001C0CED06|nr:hypothetical protein [Clostridium estertheticum]MBU3201386.1 hypothetical protein [Clostridium estertheticum]WAG66501.1 hypothetical protein LL037_04965 [Clostridium estertheticum]